MKPGTPEVVIKGTSVVLKAVFLNFAQALTQWVHSGETPDFLSWILIWSLVGAAGWDALSNFMSGTYERWKATGSLANGSGVKVDNPPKSTQVTPTPP